MAVIFDLLIEVYEESHQDFVSEQEGKLSFVKLLEDVGGIFQGELLRIDSHSFT